MAGRIGPASVPPSPVVSLLRPSDYGRDGSTGSGSDSGIMDVCQKEAKNDDSVVPVGFWNAKFAQNWVGRHQLPPPPGLENVLLVLRRQAHIVYRRRMLADFWRWEAGRSTPEIQSLLQLEPVATEN